MWIAGFAASLSWTFVDGRIVAPDRGIQWLLLGLAWCAATEGSARGAAPRFRLGGTAALVLGGLAAIAAALATPVFRPPLLIGASGALLWVLCSRARSEGRFVAIVAPVASGGLFLAMLLGAQAPLLHAYDAFTARHPTIPLLGSVLAPLLRWFGFEAFARGGELVIPTLRLTYPLPLTWTLLGAGPALLLLLGGAIVAATCPGNGSRGRRVANFVLLLFGFVMFRIAVVLALFLCRMLYLSHDSGRLAVETFWLPSVTAATFIPLLFALAWKVPIARAPRGPAVPQGGRAGASLRGRLGLAGLASAGVLGFATWIGFQDPGEQKAGRVMIDEAHSTWERTDKPFDTDWYGAEASYNYATMADLLDRYFQVERHLNGPLTDDGLRGCDVLLLKTPTSPYSDSEILAIHRFIENGGGVLALADHTNVWGSSAFLNEVVRPLGVAVRYDCVFDIDRKFEQVAFPPARLRHPALGDVPFFQFMVSASLESDLVRARPVLRQGRLWTLPIDWSVSNFYPEVYDRTDARYGTFDQIVATTFGKGRVMVSGESTVFSNFEVCFPGKSEFLLGAVSWLNRTNVWNGIELAGALVGLLGLLGLVAVLSWRGIDATDLAIAVFAGSAIGWAAMSGLDALSARTNRPPEPRRELCRVAFDFEHGSGKLPLFALTKGYHDCYAVFFQWVQRLEAFPGVRFDFEDVMRREECVVLLRPTKAFTEAEHALFRSFLERGGRALIVDSPANTASSANELLAPYGLSFDGVAESQELVESATGLPICTVGGGSHDVKGRGALRVVGGTPLLLTAKLEPLVAQVRVGQGLLLAAGLGEMFADPSMNGVYYEAPTHEHRARFEVEFALLRGMMNQDARAPCRSLEGLYGPH